jgi:hypothetical protein
MELTKGQRVQVTTRNHGHLAPSRTPSYTGIIERVSEVFTTSTGVEHRLVSVRLEPSLKNVRHFLTHRDAITVVPEREPVR